MSTLQEQFLLASEHVGTIRKDVSQAKLLRLYALWNQVESGDVDTSKAPSSMNLVKHAKFTARKKLIGVSSEVAMKTYVSLVRGIDPDWAPVAQLQSEDSLVNPGVRGGRGAGGAPPQAKSKGPGSKLFRRSGRTSANKLFRGGASASASGSGDQQAKQLSGKKLGTLFDKAATFARHSRLFNNNNSQTILYSLFKQATAGPCMRPAPRGFSRIRYAKWRAWANLFDMPKEEAMRLYVAHVRRFAPEFEAAVRDIVPGVMRDDEPEDAGPTGSVRSGLGSGRATDVSGGGAGATSASSDGLLQYSGDATSATSAKELLALMQSASEHGGLVYVMTGASGFLGSHLIGELLQFNANSVVLALTRPTSRAKLLGKLAGMYGEEASGRVVPLDADIAEKGLGLAKDVQAALVSSASGVDHFFHLAASYDMEASDAHNERSNVDGTRYAVELANALGKAHDTTFQYTSSIVVAGNYDGLFFESMFNEGQEFDNPYARTKFQAEELVRAKCSANFRIHRPGIVVGSSATGEAEKIDGPYYFFASIQALRKLLPSAMTLPMIEGGSLPLVPVNYVVAAMAAIAHNESPALNGRAFHLVDPSPLTVVEVLNVLAKAAHAPGFSPRLSKLAQVLVPARFWGGVDAIPLLAGAPKFIAKNALGIPENVYNYTFFKTDYDDEATREALAGTGLRCPKFKSYAWRLWDYYERVLDPSLNKSLALQKEVKGKVVVITGSSDGIGLVLAHRVAKAGAHVVLVARNKEKLDKVQKAIAAEGGSASIAVADLSLEDPTYAAIDQINKEFGAVDFLINNAGRSIRRSAEYQRDRFHDFERLMSLNYFGCTFACFATLLSSNEEQVTNSLISPCKLNSLAHDSGHAARHAPAQGGADHQHQLHQRSD